MKILLVIDSLGSGGAQRQMAYLARGLAQRHHTVTLFVYHPDQSFYASSVELANITVVSVQKKSRFDLSPMRALKQQIRANQFDAAVAFLPSPAIYLLAARGLNRLPPVIVSHRRTYEAERIAGADRMILSTYVAAQTIVANSRRGSEQIAASLPFLASKLRVISNAVELEKFAPSPTIGDAGRTNLLFVGRLVPEKNIIRVLDAMAIIKAQGGPVPKLSWAGRYDAGPAAERYATELHACIERHGLSEYWEPLGERTDLPQLLARCDALVLASTFEGTPNAVCEALAAGRPVLSSRVGDIEHLVQDGVSGFLFNALSADGIADAISRFTRTNADQRAEMGKAARRFAEENFSVDAYIDTWESCIKAVAYPRQNNPHA